MVQMFVPFLIISYLMIGLSWLAWVDFKTGYLPDHILIAIGIGGMGALITCPLTSLTYLDSILGALINGIVFWCLRYCVSKVKRQEAMGLGDVKLVIVGGVWLGPWALPYIMGVSALSTLICITLTRLVTGHVNWKTEIPLGPGLSLAIFSAYLIQISEITEVLGPSALILNGLQSP